MAAQRMASTDAIQIKDSGTNGKYYAVRHNVGTWVSAATATSSSIVVVTTTSITYNKRGYYSAGAAYEYWQSTNRDAPAPSGHSLLDVTVISEYKN